MRQMGKKFFAFEAVLVAVSILALTGCGKTPLDSPHTETGEAQYDMVEEQAVSNDGQEHGNEEDAVQNSDAEIGRAHV